MDSMLEDGELSGSDSEMTPSVRPLPADHCLRAAPPVASGYRSSARPAASSGEGRELSGSDSEMTSSVRPPPADSSFRPAPPEASGYRSSARPAASSGDSSGEEEDDEPIAGWRCKRQKVSNAAVASQRPPPTAGLGGPDAAAGRKVNNVWGSVVQEQSQDLVMAGLGVFGMEGDFDMGSRNVETYNYVLARKMMEKERREEEEKARGQQHQEAAMLDSQLEDYMQARGGHQDHSRPKRKRPAKERLGSRAEMDLEGRYELREEDPEPRVVEELAHRLQEPKLDLLERVVSVLGRGPAIRLLEETAALERAGGVTTLDGSRRRTPGGVYLHLLKSSPDVSRAQLRQVFLEENADLRRSKKAAQKRRRHLVAKKMKNALNTLHLQEDQESRETFASDTHDALASLGEEPEEEEPEEEEEEEPEVVAVGTEETPVVYNPADLEVF
ncbi:unnamed protein product [Boreogadus saida]